MFAEPKKDGKFSKDILKIIIEERKAKERFYIDRIVNLALFYKDYIDKNNLDNERGITNIEFLRDDINTYLQRLADNYDEYINKFNLKIVVPIKNLKFDKYSVSQNLSHFDLKDYADFIKLGGNVVKNRLFNLNTMSKNQIELELYLRFVNMLIYDVRLNYLNEETFELFLALNDDETGMKLLATTNWYLQFYDADLFFKKWNYFKKMRFSDYLSASCLVIKK
ncbi:hypothetical protein [Arcobacter cloacae]|uniref:Uncharacterized protein n=1 Tax=Arcobacter cloacae TaxID=1054034 RepID=A0A6M8NJP7_9BACT|nr:hypothetical protein [Arcobacter cloacae]QKF90719.1 hypothetical protein ACLO_2262 [Arcobacter cloacae]RXI41501.1 hypothetical protein CP963_06950 [Arcobacter cloacae]